MKEEFDWKKSTLAHPGKRYQGQFIDGLISIILFAGTIYVCKVIGLEGRLADTLIVIIPTAYFIFSDAFPAGQSLGKKLLGISVISKTTGKPCKIWQSFARNVFTPILGVFDAILILRKNRQRLGDKFANTIVIKNGE